MAQTFNNDTLEKGSEKEFLGVTRNIFLRHIVAEFDGKTREDEKGGLYDPFFLASV